MTNRNETLPKTEMCESKNDDFLMHMLNDDCLMEIFAYLGYTDTRTLGKISDRLRTLSYLRYNKITFNFHTDMVREGDAIIDSFLLDIGPHMRSWSFIVTNLEFAKRIFKKVTQYCSILKSLKGTALESLTCNEVIDCLQHVETLVGVGCDFDSGKNFITHFRGLKSIVFAQCFIRSKDVKIMFENNPKLESFYLDGGSNLGGGDGIDEYGVSRFIVNDLNQCQFSSKFKILCLMSRWQFIQMDSLLRLAKTNLTKLKIEMFTENLNIFLTELAKEGLLVELELKRVQLDRQSFNVLQLFRKLELLVFCPLNMTNTEFKLDATLVWPANLKKLRSDLDITIGGFVIVIQQLKYLEHFDLSQSVIDTQYQAYFHNFEEMTRSILYKRESKRKLNIFLPVYCSVLNCSEFYVDIDGLRISRVVRSFHNPKRIRIDFPSMKLV